MSDCLNDLTTTNLRDNGSCFSYVYVFSKKNYMEGCSVLYRKADVPEVSGKGSVF